ncbi:MAG: hypothetical protein PHP85_05175 [Gallionella sp.]|nr:hypothetical protein [Gallionella sp.]
MTTNSIEAGVEFSFRGVDYTHTVTIDLDELLRQHDAPPSIHVILARQHGIDTYSYLYEVMQEADIEFSRPQGYAKDYLKDGKFDLPFLAANWQSAKTTALLQPIALRELGIEDLYLHPALWRALLEAYNLGRSS